MRYYKVGICEGDALLQESAVRARDALCSLCGEPWKPAAALAPCAGGTLGPGSVGFSYIVVCGYLEVGYHYEEAR